MASFSAGGNGALVATTLPPLKTPAIQNVQGGILNAATAKSGASRQEAADAYKNLGGGQKGGRRMRGGSGPGNVPASPLPTAGSIPGVSHATVMQKIINNHNDIVTAGAYDKLGSAPPIKLGGRRVKKRRSTKKHGRRRNRTHRRRGKRTSHIRSRSRRSIH
jgi:hypothetical protein